MAGELSVFRSEDKYLLSYDQALSLKDKLAKLLHKDAHSGDTGYVVRSLYFDSISHIDFTTKMAGTEIRKKIRLRIYNPRDPVCKLEVKQKNGDLQHKVSLIVTKDDAQALSLGDCSVLTKYFSQSQNAVYMYKTMMLGGYRPVALIEYDRIAYTYPRFNTRLTLDMNVRSVEGRLDLFDSDPIFTPVLDEQVVLEVKYNQKLMGFISQVLRPYHLTKVSVSKYCTGRRIFYDINY